MRAKLISGRLRKSTLASAGYDMFATEPRVIYPGEDAVVATGVFIEISTGYEGQVRGRSGLNFKHGIVVPVGTVDSDYRGEVKVKMYNLSNQTFKIAVGDRIAQLVIAEHYEIEGAEIVEEERGDSGFGSTGK